MKAVSEAITKVTSDRAAASPPCEVSSTTINNEIEKEKGGNKDKSQGTTSSTENTENNQAKAKNITTEVIAETSETVEIEGFSKHAKMKHILSNLLFTNNNDDLSEFNEDFETKEEKENCDPINQGPDDANSFESKPSTCTILVTPIQIRAKEPCMVKIMPKLQTTAYNKNNDIFVENEQEIYEEDVSSRHHSISPDHNEKFEIPCFNEKLSKKLVKILPKPQTAASIRKNDVFVKNEEGPSKSKESKIIDHFFSQDHTMKYIRC